MKLSRTMVVLAFALGLVASTATAKEQSPFQTADRPQIQVTVLGMSCPFCVYGVQQKLKGLEGVSELNVDLSSGLATLTMEEDADVANERLIELVEQAGFEVAMIRRNFESEFPNWSADGGTAPAA